MIDLAWLAKAIGTRAAKEIETLAKESSAKKTAAARDELCADVAGQLTRMILSGKDLDDVQLVNLYAEFKELVARGARVPRDVATSLATMMITLEREQENKIRYAASSFTTTRARTHDSVSGAALSQRRPAAKKAAAKRPAARKAAAKRPAQKGPPRKAAKTSTTAKKRARLTSP